MQVYYDIVSSLPDISLGDDAKKIKALNFYFSLDGVLNEDDFYLLKLLYTFLDDVNLCQFLENKEKDFLVTGLFTKKIIESEFKFPVMIPEYMQDLFLMHSKAERSLPSLYLLDEIYVFHYKELFEKGTLFLKNYYRFDLLLRNVLVVINCFKYGIDHKNKILPVGDFYEHFLKMTSSNFSFLAGETWVQDVMLMKDDSMDLFACEKKIIELKLHFIDQQLALDIFGVDRIFGHALKLLLLERLLTLSKESGLNKVNDLCRKLEALQI